MTPSGARVPDCEPKGVDGDLRRALGDEHVGPEVAEAAEVPRTPGALRHGPVERVEERRVLEALDRRDVDPLSVRVRSPAALRPPAPAERGRRDDRDLVVEGDQGRPDRDPARVVPRPVDRVDDPAASPRRPPPRRARPRPGARARSVRRSVDSTRRSASETGVRSGFVSTWRSAARKRAIEIASASSARERANSRSELTLRHLLAPADAPRPGRARRLLLVRRSGATPAARPRPGRRAARAPASRAPRTG